MKQKILTSLLGLLVLISTPLLAAEPSVLIQTGVVTRQTVSETLTAYGEVQPDTDYVRSFSLRHAGIVKRVLVQAGQRVRRGDHLMKVGTAPDAVMQFLQAQNTVVYARKELQRRQRLFKEQLTTHAEIDAARKTMRDAQARLNALRQRGDDEDGEILIAPMDGVVTQINVSRGQRVMADTTVALIAAEHHLVAQLGVEPEDLPAIKTNTPVQLSSVFVPDYLVSSRVRDVHAMIDPATRLVPVTVPIPKGKEDHLVFGTRLKGCILLSEHQALTVPRSAVLRDDRESYLFRVLNDRASRVTVGTGVEQGGRIEISGKLKAGETIITSGNYELSDGMQVREEGQ